MRSDIESLKSSIRWDDTVSKFGVPTNNRSMVVCACSSCMKLMDVSVRWIKSRKSSTCRSCSTSLSASSSWASDSYREKHRVGCVKSYTDDRRAAVSESSKRSWTDPSFRAQQVKAKKNLWGTKEFREKQKAFKMEEFKKNQSERQKAVSERPGYKEIRSEKQKAVWSDPEYRSIQSEKQKAVWSDPEYRARCMLLWNDPERRFRISQTVKAAWLSESMRASASEASKKKWDDPDYRSKVTSSIKERWGDPSYRELKRTQSLAMWKDESYREKAGLARSAQSGRRSSIEVVTERILSDLGVPYAVNSLVGHYLFDFFLPENDVYVECQGEYRHSRDGVASKDAAKASYLESAKPSSRLLYLHEREFMNPNSVVSKICSFLSGGTLNRTHIDNFDLDSVSIRKIGREDSFKLLSSYHYAGYGRSSKVTFGAFVVDELAAVFKLSPVVRTEVATSMGMGHREVLELDRFCIHPKYQKKNFASWFISRAAQMTFLTIKEVMRIVSFADMTYGHDGTMYKASNWKEAGRVAPDYCYIGPDGFIIHKKTLYNRAVRMSMKEAEYASSHGYEKSFGKEKIKFFLDRPKYRAHRVTVP